MTQGEVVQALVNAGAMGLAGAVSLLPANHVGFGLNIPAEGLIEFWSIATGYGNGAYAARVAAAAAAAGVRPGGDVQSRAGRCIYADAGGGLHSHLPGHGPSVLLTGNLAEAQARQARANAFRHSTLDTASDTAQKLQDLMEKFAQLSKDEQKETEKRKQAFLAKVAAAQAARDAEDTNPTVFPETFFSSAREEGWALPETERPPSSRATDPWAAAAGLARPR